MIAVARNAPVAPVFVRAMFLARASIAIAWLATGTPPAVALPVKTTRCPGFGFPRSVTVGVAITPTAATWPAGFGVAVPARYGTNVLTQAEIGAAGGARTPLTVK